MRKLCLLLVAIAVISACSDTILVEETSPELRSASSDYPKLDPGGEMPIAVYWMPPFFINKVSGPRQWAKEAGFTHIIDPFFSIDNIGECLDKIYATDPNLKVIISWDLLKNQPTSGNRDLEDFVERFGNHPASAGFHVWDEPSGQNIDSVIYRLNNYTERINAILSGGRFCYINMFPTYARQVTNYMSYSDYVSRIGSLPTPMLSFDHYPIYGEYEIDPITKDTLSSDTLIRMDFYENLEIIAAKSRDLGKPFWAFALSGSHLNYPVPNLAHLRLQVYSNLAYGAQGIQYYSYVAHTQQRFRDAPVTYTGGNAWAVVKSNTYDTVKLMNEKIKNLTGVFLGSEVISVKHTGSDSVRPNGTTKHTATFSNPYIKNVQHFILDDSGVIVSELRNGNNRFRVIVNRSFKKSINLSITFSRSSSIKQILDDGSIIPAGNELAPGVPGMNTIILNKTVAPGDILIYMYPDF